MTRDRAYLEQARSDLTAFALLLSQPREIIPACHALHHLQMATEKLAKAARIASGVSVDLYSHVALSVLPQQLSRRDVALALGWSSWNQYRQALRQIRPVFREIEELHPGIGPKLPGGAPREGPNVEYPWEIQAHTGASEWRPPCLHGFSLLGRLQTSVDGRRALDFIRILAERFEGVFGTQG